MDANELKLGTKLSSLGGNEEELNSPVSSHILSASGKVGSILSDILSNKIPEPYKFKWVLDEDNTTPLEGEVLVGYTYDHNPFWRPPPPVYYCVK